MARKKDVETAENAVEEKEKDVETAENTVEEKDVETAENAVEEKEKDVETAENTVEEKDVETAENAVEEKGVETAELSFSKKAFLSSKTYKSHRDLLETVLENGRNYTKSEVNNLIDDYLKGKVK